MKLSRCCHAFNSLIDGYDKCGELEEVEKVEKVMEEMKRYNIAPDVVTFNELISCFCKFGRMEKVYIYFGGMKR
jgi:pentatricopeptide repeat domain-containing protein 1